MRATLYGVLMAAMVMAAPILVSALKVGFIGDSGDNTPAQLVFKMMRDAGVDLVIDVGDLDYRNDPGRWNNFLGAHWFNGKRGFLAVSGDHETLYDGKGRWDIGGDDTYRVRLFKSLRQDSNMGLQQKCKGRDGKSLRDEFGKFTTCEVDNLFVAMIGWDEQQFTYKEELAFLRQRFASTTAKWRVCIWHRPEGAYQGRGTTEQDQGRLEAYDICRQGGAVIYTGHAHNYMRSKLMNNFKQKSVSSRHQNSRVALSCGSNGESFAVNTGIGGRSITGTNNRFPHTAEEWSGDQARARGVDPNSRGAVLCDFGASQATCGLSVIQPDGKVHNVDPWTMTSTCGSGSGGGIPTTAPAPTRKPTPSTPRPSSRPTLRPVENPPDGTLRPTTPEPTTPKPTDFPTPKAPVRSPTVSRVPSPSPTEVFEIEPVCNQGDGLYKMTEPTDGEIRPIEEYIYLRAPLELLDTDQAWMAVTYLHPVDRLGVREFEVHYNAELAETYAKAELVKTLRQERGTKLADEDNRWTAYIRLTKADFRREQNCQADMRLASVKGMRIEHVRLSAAAPLEVSQGTNPATKKENTVPLPALGALGGLTVVLAFAAIVVRIRNKRKSSQGRSIQTPKQPNARVATYY